VHAQSHCSACYADVGFLLYLQQQVALLQDGGLLPGIGGGTVGGPMPPSKASVVPVKVTNVSLGGFGERVPWSGTLQYDTQLLQAMSLQASNAASGDDRMAGKRAHRVSVCLMAGKRARRASVCLSNPAAAYPPWKLSSPTRLFHYG